MKLRKKSKLQGEQEKERTQKMPTEGMEDYSIAVSYTHLDVYKRHVYSIDGA